MTEGPCLGERAARLCELAAIRPDYRRLLVERARDLASGGTRPPTLPELLAAVAACPDRGGILPHSLQPACGCDELSECRRGRGAHPGRVALGDCLACTSRLAPTSPHPADGSAQAISALA